MCALFGATKSLGCSFACQREPRIRAQTSHGAASVSEEEEVVVNHHAHYKRLLQQLLRLEAGTRYPEERGSLGVFSLAILDEVGRQRA